MGITIKETDNNKTNLGAFRPGKYFIYRGDLHITTSDYIPQSSVNCVELSTGKVVVLKTSTLVKEVKDIYIEYALSK